MDERDLDPDPLRQFGLWFDEARDAGIEAPESMALATSTPDGRPSVCMVLLKRTDEQSRRDLNPSRGRGQGRDRNSGGGARGQRQHGEAP